jgi:hypothetical protein
MKMTKKKAAKKTAKKATKKNISLLDFCKPPENKLVNVDYEGLKIPVRIREFMSSDREALVDFADGLNAIQLKLRKALEDKKEYIFSGAETLLLQNYKAKQAWLLLVDENGAPIFPTFEDMKRSMRPKLLDAVANEVEKHLGKGVGEAEKP